MNVLLLTSESDFKLIAIFSRETPTTWKDEEFAVVKDVR